MLDHLLFALLLILVDQFRWDSRKPAVATWLNLGFDDFAYVF